MLRESGDNFMCNAVGPFTADIIITCNMYPGNSRSSSVEDFIMSGLKTEKYSLVPRLSLLRSLSLKSLGRVNWREKSKNCSPVCAYTQNTAFFVFVVVNFFQKNFVSAINVACAYKQLLELHKNFSREHSTQNYYQQAYLVQQKFIVSGNVSLIEYVT